MITQGNILKNLSGLLILLILSPAVCAAELFGTVDALSGSASLIDQAGQATSIAIGMNIYEGQSINSEADGEVHLVTEDGGIIAVRPNTVFRVDEYKADGGAADKIFMSLLKGTIRSITGWIGKFDNSAYRITTPTATIGVRGTDHETTVIEKGNGDEPGTYDNVNEGVTVMKTPQGSAEVTPGKFAFASRERPAPPFFLAQRPHFLSDRRLKIEDRIQQRKDILRGRLNQMREERINRVKSLQGNRRSANESGMNIRNQQREQKAEHRRELRAQHYEQARQPQAHRAETAWENRQALQRGKGTHNMQRRENRQNDIYPGEKNRHAAERNQHMKMRRE
ncbi:hypothetical protein MIZ01_1034 [Sideroxyarcus emersonii]|uniref:FecR protein domain-containing protein n=1 Tax=Sideroxyarcus emersonii TaxID=2764705 RepID=A0AAN2BYZ6_9PROT|nr:FecR domain-containing protein [Sideroxyarcus emersonii]BCK87262.1 hypothetical protein MIZ01_1034 [Sideroxyarcus emersonii]